MKSTAPKIQIDKGVPIPTGYGGYKYPWESMKPGDSFFVPNKTIKVVSASVAYAREKYGFTFRCRSIDGGVRVWRVT
jgi:hypothetical protein